MGDFEEKEVEIIDKTKEFIFECSYLDGIEDIRRGGKVFGDQEKYRNQTEEGDLVFKMNVKDQKIEDFFDNFVDETKKAKEKIGKTVFFLKDGKPSDNKVDIYLVVKDIFREN